MFGLFENKQGRALVSETLRTIEHADLLSTKDKNKVAKNVFTKIIKANPDIVSLFEIESYRRPTPGFS